MVGSKVLFRTALVASVSAFGLLAATCFAGASAQAAETTTYTYDALGRLTNASRSGTVSNGVVSSYEYDKAGNRSKVTVTGAGNAAPSFSINSVTVTEGGLATFTVTKGGSGAATVNFATANGTAGAADFDAKSDTLSFGVGETIQTITVQTKQDAISDPDETFTVILSSPSAGATIVTGTGTATITDVPPASFSINSVSVEEGGLATFTVTKTGSDAGSVNYATAPGTAGAGDFTAASDTLSFAAGETSKTFTVQTTQDAINDPDETFTVTLSSPSTGAVIGTGTGTATITEPVPGSFSINSVTVNEGGVATFTVTKTGTSPASVSYATTAGTAGAADFTAASDTLDFAAGETSRTFTVQTTADSVNDPNETFTVTLSNPTAGATIGTATGTATITDVPATTFSINSVTVNEGGLATFTVSKTGGGAGSISYTTSPGTAGSADFTAVSDTLTFAAGDTTKTFTVQTTPDMVNDPNETFTVTLSNPSAGTFIGTGTGTATITDVPPISFSVNNASAAEGGTVAFTVTKSGTASGTLTVNYATSNGTATAGSDYTAASGTLSFLAGDTTKTVNVVTAQDVVSDPNETFTLTLSNPTAGTVIGTATGTGTITDVPPISFAVNSVSVNEGGLATFTVTKTGTGGGSVNYATATGTAGAADFTAASGILTFTSGETTKTFTVQTTSDAVTDPNETFSVTLSNPSAGAVIGTATGTGTIVDAPAVSFSINNVGVREGSIAAFTVTKTGTASGTLTVNYATANGTASSASDYTAGSGTLTFLAGDTTKTVNVQTTQDSSLEQYETFTVGLSNPSAGSTISNGTGTSTITDDDTSGTRVWIDKVEYVEQANPVFYIRREGPPATFSVDYATSDGTAIAGTHYTAKSGTVTFYPWDSYKTVTVTVAPDDSIVEPDRTFNMNLSNATNGVPITYGSATGRIMDDDGVPAGNDFWYINDDFVIEGNFLTVTVYRLNTSSGAATISYNLAPGTAVAGSDYTAASGTLSFSSSQTTRTLIINTTENSVIEGDETLNVILTPTKSGDIVAGATPDAEILILDDD